MIEEHEAVRTDDLVIIDVQEIGGYTVVRSKKEETMHRIKFVTVVVILVVLCGCSNFTRYCIDRVYDFTDMFSVSLSAGPGLIVNTRITCMAQVGIGIGAYIYKAGFIRRSYGVWKERYGCAEFGISPLLYWRVFTTDTLCGNIRFDGTFESYTIDRLLSGRVLHWEYSGSGDRSLYEIGFTAHCLVGVNAAVDLFELADFILGWFGLDIAKDDKPPPEPEEETIKEP